MSKMYIAVLDSFPDYMTPTLVAHAVLQHDDVTVRRFQEDMYYTIKYLGWKQDSFKKVVVKVNQKAFDKISKLPGVTLSHENNTLNGKKACAVVVVDDNIPNVLKFAKLWSPEGVKPVVQLKVGDGVRAIENDRPYYSKGALGYIVEIEKMEKESIYLVQFTKGDYLGEHGVSHKGSWWAGRSKIERI